MQEIKYYESYTEDFVKSHHQDMKIPKSYKWIHINIFYNMCSDILYFIAKIFSWFYVKFVLDIEVVNGDNLKECRDKGYFLYGNHSHPWADVIAPAQYASTNRVCAIASPANLGLDS